MPSVLNSSKIANKWRLHADAVVKVIALNLLQRPPKNSQTMRRRVGLLTPGKQSSNYSYTILELISNLNSKDIHCYFELLQLVISASKLSYSSCIRDYIDRYHERFN